MKQTRPFSVRLTPEMELAEEEFRILKRILDGTANATDYRRQRAIQAALTSLNEFRNLPDLKGR